MNIIGFYLFSYFSITYCIVRNPAFGLQWIFNKAIYLSIKITGQFAFCSKARAGHYQDYHDVIVYEKHRNPAFFNFLRLEERFRKAPYRDGLVWTVGLTDRRNKSAFSNSSAQCGGNLRQY